MRQRANTTDAHTMYSLSAAIISVSLTIHSNDSVVAENFLAFALKKIASKKKKENAFVADDNRYGSK